MDMNVAEAWVEALRSGEFDQGMGHLRFQDEDSETPKYCCLGVLCELAIKSDVPLPVDKSDLGGLVSYGARKTSGTLPGEVMEWSGMRSHVGYTYASPKGEVKGVPDLTELNDSGKTFAEIADYIEENWMFL